MVIRSFTSEEVYHIYDRGVEKRTIFQGTDDYERFLSLLYLCNSSKSIVVRDIPHHHRYTHERGEVLVQIGAYCLMPNHFHIIARQAQENGISKFMQKVMTAYTMYFNVLNKRKGGLFEGTFKSKYVESDEQLRYLQAYVHLNPISTFPNEKEWKQNGIKNKDGVIAALKHSPVTSFQDSIEYRRDSPKANILSLEAFPEDFRISGDGESTLREWVNMFSLRVTTEV